ncbi:hypothetical protein D3C78_1943540 [compost metagenome]
MKAKPSASSMRVSAPISPSERRTRGSAILRQYHKAASQEVNATATSEGTTPASPKK